MFISWLILSLIFKTVLSVSLGKQYYDLTTTKYVQKTSTNNPQISQNTEFKPSHHDYESRIQEHDFQDIGDVITFTNDLGHIGIQLPLVPSRKTRRRKRNQVTGAIGLGTVQDVTYNVLVNVGNTSTPLVLDTGSSDLWLLSTSCTSSPAGCTTSSDPLPPLYPVNSTASTFTSANVPAILHYGDSNSGTFAHGIIGSDTATLAGLTSTSQYFAEIGETNTSVVQTGAAGLFGLGFPVNSVIWNRLYSKHLNETTQTTTRRALDKPDIPPHRRLPSISYPSAPRLSKNKAASPGNSPSPIPILSSFSIFGPFLSRFVLPSSSHPFHLPSPLFTVSLQRTTPSSQNSSPGLLTLGSLPKDVSNDTITWAPVRLYHHGEQGGLKASEASEEIYPFAWEVEIEDVWFDGVKLARSGVGDAGKVGLSALVDTGNSLIRGPPDVIRAIFDTLTSQGPSDASDFASDPSAILASSSDTRAALAKGLYPCNQPHTLSFQISGKRFDVDARDFGNQAFVNSVDMCLPNLIATDPPTVGGYLYSWSLGTPFLKGVLASFYYGNITHPSQDPPRIGFLSTVPQNSGELLQEAVQQAADSGSNFPITTIPAPTGTFSTLGVDVSGEASRTQTATNSASRTRPFSSLGDAFIKLAILVSTAVACFSGLAFGLGAAW